MRDKKLHILLWIAGGFMAPPVFWLFFGWFFNIWSLSEMIRIILSPWMWIYVVLILFVGIFISYNKLKIVETAEKNTDPDQLERARKVFCFIPIFILAFWCL